MDSILIKKLYKITVPSLSLLKRILRGMHRFSEYFIPVKEGSSSTPIALWSKYNRFMVKIQNPHNLL
jgi:hypothetical protein